MKKLEEMTIRDNFMFAAVMTIGDNCQELLEMVLDIEIDHVEVNYEKTIVYHPEYHGVRLDVYAKDAHNTRYDVEMQATVENVPLRSRYYHSQMDMDLLEAGEKYENLPDSYVIFICDFDPFGEAKYKYTVKQSLMECDDKPFPDGRHTIILSTVGTNNDQISEKLHSFLNFVRNGHPSSDTSEVDSYTLKLQDSIRRVKSSREMRIRFMVLENMLRKEREEGIELGRAEGVELGRAEGEELGRIKGLCQLVINGLLPFDIALQQANIPEDEFRKFMDSMK